MTPSLRRLTREQADLLKNPDPTFHAAPISASNLYDWHFTLQGPPAPSPYSEGIYHGRIVLPPTYPLRPPSFRFLTPSGRFEVNREICLSISGHHEETWQPAWGIRTALIALRSFMDGDARGQVGGLDVGEEVRRRYAVASRGWRCEGCKGQIFGEDEEGDEEGAGGQAGRTNLEVLEAWWGFCRERGVDVSGFGGRKAVEGEGKGEEGEGDNADLEKKTEEQEQEVGKGDQELEPPTIGSLKSDTGVSGREDAQTHSTTSTTTAAAASTPPSTTQLPAVQQQPDQTPQQRQILLQSQPQPQPQPQPQHQQQQQISPDTPWLDRAIFGVIVALVVMILRRIARDE
ncbi:ubiquitin-conjugating enzyme E2 [Aspergillus fijiensis CBS 313.89]|uniref:UBC-like protein n=1 Tax=Aspergillus fijiensis CBS 313.89 TaxID=1448319 RepID=A0A8G1RUN5_9EURO|nr:UBC-like protein [Aspergillus fijiensis CBS 313.89]RAK79569.1 UBC-like protein [Aspergillus fijiensis CBS 313.89]